MRRAKGEATKTNMSQVISHGPAAVAGTAAGGYRSGLPRRGDAAGLAAHAVDSHRGPRGIGRPGRRKHDRLGGLAVGAGNPNPSGSWVLGMVVFVLLAAHRRAAMRAAVSRQHAAAEIENAFPDLGQRVCTTLEYAEPTPETMPAWPSLVTALSRETSDRTRGLDFQQVVPWRRLLRPARRWPGSSWSPWSCWPPVPRRGIAAAQAVPGFRCITPNWPSSPEITSQGRDGRHDPRDPVGPAGGPRGTAATQSGPGTRLDGAFRSCPTSSRTKRSRRP